MTMSTFIVIPAVGMGGLVALNPDHIVRVSLDQEPHAVGQHAGRVTLRLYLVDGTIQVARGIENIREILAKLDIEGLRPRPRVEEEVA